MIDWIATTKSGAKYFSRDGRISYNGSSGAIYFHNGQLKSVNREELSESEDPWEYLRNLPEIEVPELGKALYVNSINEWRISTVVTDIEFPGIDNPSEVN